MSRLPGRGLFVCLTSLLKTHMYLCFLKKLVRDWTHNSDYGIYKPSFSGKGSFDNCLIELFTKVEFDLDICNVVEFDLHICNVRDHSAIA